MCALQAELGDRSSDLGPICRIPAALEICGLHRFSQSVIDAYVYEDEKSVFRPTLESVLDELNDCVCQNRHQAPSTGPRTLNLWWESTFTRHMLVYFNDPCVKTNQRDLGFSALCHYGVRIKGFPKLIEVNIVFITNLSYILLIVTIFIVKSVCA